MKSVAVAALFAPLLASVTVFPADAQALQACQLGQKVKTPAGALATVVAIDGSACTIHKDGDPQTLTDVWSASMLVSADGTAPVAATETTLPAGEYACYSGSTILLGMGLNIHDASTYGDLDDRTEGTFLINGDSVSFSDGHLDGQTGTNIHDNGFTLGAAIFCQLWN